MRLLFLFTFCFFCSCAYLDGVFEGTPSLIDKSSAAKNNSTEGQSKQVESHAEEEEGVDEEVVKLTTPPPPWSQDVEFTAVSRMGLLQKRLNDQKTLKGHKAEAVSIFRFSEGNLSSIVTISSEGEVLMWGLNGNLNQAKFVTNIPPGFTSLGFNSRSLYLSAAYPSNVKIFDLVSGEKIFETARIITRINAMDFSPNEGSMLLAGADGIVYRWQYELELTATRIIDKEKIIERYIAHPSVVNMVRFHPFGRVFLSTDWGGILNAWLLFSSDRYDGRFDENLFGGRFFSEDVNRIRSSRKVNTIIEQMEFSKDGNYFYIADEGGNLEIWQMRGFKQNYTFLGHKGKIYDMCLSPAQDILFSLGRDGKLKKWKITSEASKFPGQIDYALELAREVDYQNGRKIVCLDSSRVGSVAVGSNALEVIELAGDDVKTEE